MSLGGPTAVAFLAIWAGLVVSVLVAYRAELARAWREPVLRRPVLIVESDDWGPGPPEDALWLSRLAEILSRYMDRQGRHPVATIGVVLALPGPKPATNPAGAEREVSLASEAFRSIRAQLTDGAARRVLALQLHGLEHYWLPALVRAAETDRGVAEWLEGRGGWRTESLPPRLQARWVDGSALPSSPLTDQEIVRAVREELSAFEAVFSRRPTVVVPPTFVWDQRVEREWARGGVRYLVTPGRRYVGRDASGRLVSDRETIRTGERGEGALVYLVRDRYFEPSLGHRAEHALSALAEKSRAGRPTLLETHRFNFIGDPAAAERALGELDRLLASALASYPDLCFLSTEELGDRLVAQDPELVDTRPSRRICAWLVRLAETSRLRKLAMVTGLAAAAWLYLRFVRPLSTAHGAARAHERLAT